MFFYLQTMSKFFEIWIFIQDIWGNVHYVRETNLISWETQPFISRSKEIERILRHGLVDERHLITAEGDNAKNKCFPEYTLHLFPLQSRPFL